MRIETIYCSYKYQALKLCPWAALCFKVDGGFKCFESVSDGATWLSQL